MRSRASHSEYWRWYGEVAIIVLLYFGAARLGLLMALAHKNVSPVWPPSGFALAALLVRGRRIWPAVFLGAFLANYSTDLSFQTALLIGIGNTLEAVLGASLLRRLEFQNTLGRLRDALGLILAAIVSPMMAATIGVVGLWTGGFLRPSAGPLAWWAWWLGDSMGILVVTPVLLAWIMPLAAIRSWAETVKPWRVLEAAALLLSLVGITQYIFYVGREYPYAVFPLLIWATMRFGQRGAATAIVIVSSLTIVGTLQGLGPFVRGTTEQSLEFLQTFMGVVSITTLIMAATMADRIQAEEERERLIQELQQHQVDIEALNERLRRTVAETHHRVKNNLQIICALIELQEQKEPAPIARSEFRWLNQHVHSLAVLHDLLTREAKRAPDSETIRLQEMMQNLVPLLQNMVGNRRLHVRVEDVRVPVRQGTALAVLINELVSNALKHGEGDIDLALTVSASNARLEVCDGGPGFPREFDPQMNPGTGMELIGSLSTWDLGGQVSFENCSEGGARVVVTFPLDKNKGASDLKPPSALETLPAVSP